MMQTSSFDAVVEFDDSAKEIPHPVLICVDRIAVPASLHRIGEKTTGGREGTFVHIHPAKPLSLRWKQTFTIKCPRTGEIRGKGTVLDPIAGKFVRRQKKRRMQYLDDLLGNEKQMLLAVVQHKGIQGLHEKDLIRFSHHSREHLLDLSQELESEAQIRILEFSPLFIISQTAVIFLCEKILKFLSQYHEKHPENVGAERETIRKRFAVHSRVLILALKYLNQKRQIKFVNDHVALYSFEMTLLPEEEEILDRMEEMYLKDKFQSFSLEELKRSFRLSSRQLNKLLSLLIERKKIVLGREGFILHSVWLDEIIQKIRNLGKKELTVAEFKKMTGLTRKYAIPLLELLDQRGITRRRGSTREIL
jgi:selenocysteine-specific elongation factor